MRVQEALMRDGRTRYIVVDHEGNWVMPVCRYLNWLADIERARNTVRAHAHDLRLFWEYLDQKGVGYDNITLDDMGGFLQWLKNPYRSVTIVPILPVGQARANVTINRILATVSSFYDYLWRLGGLSQDVNAMTHRPMPLSQRAFKGFLAHVSSGQTIQANILHQRVTRTKPKVLTQDQVRILCAAANNKRDKLLINLLYQSSIRIGEALALWFEDLDIVNSTISICDRGGLVNGAEIKTPSSVRTVDISDALMNQILDFAAEAHGDEVETNHVFIKLKGANAGKPLSYPEVYDVFRRLEAKTGISATPHTLRHTSATDLLRDGWRPEHLRERLGHKHYQTTVNLYLHPSDEDMRREWKQSEAKMDLRRGTTVVDGSEAASSNAPSAMSVNEEVGE